MPLPMILVTLVGALAYMGVAIWAEGGVRAYFSHPALTAVFVIQLALAVAALFTRGNVSTGVREDRRNRWVLIAFGVIGLTLAWAPPYADRVGFWTLDGEPMRWIGVALMAVGGTARLWPVFVLGRRFSGLVAIQENHTLVTGGIYRVIRHPSYLGLMVGALGWALAFRSGVGVILTALMVPPLVARIRAEEAMLHREFGADYDAYRARTSRLIPGLY